MSQFDTRMLTLFFFFFSSGTEFCSEPVRMQSMAIVHEFIGVLMRII